MTVKYHISPTTGRPNKCYAEKKPCPLASADEHYGSKDEARQAYEGKMSSSTMPAAQKKASKGQSLEELRAAYDDVRRNYEGEDRRERIQAAERALEAVLPPVPTPPQLMAGIETPAGLRRTEGVEQQAWGNFEPRPQLVLESDDVRIEINFSSDASYMLADGHVSFNSSQGWRTFDRRGVDDSFYIDNPRKQYSDEDPTPAANEAIKDFLERKIPEARARIDGSEAVPGLNGRLASKAQKQELADKGSVQLYPSGFGTGYHFFTGATWANQPDVREASPEQKAFFGVKNLWVSTFDCD